jgi:hypothetical protein
MMDNLTQACEVSYVTPPIDHPLIILNRSFCAREFTLEGLFAQLQEEAPGLIIEVEEEQPVSLASKTVADSEIIDIDFTTPMPPLPGPPQVPVTEAEKIIKKTAWMNKQTTQSNYPYDDYGAVKPMEP